MPPYSSTTMAHCVCWRWNCFSSSGTRLVSGTTTAGRTRSLSGRPSSLESISDQILDEDEAGDVVQALLVDGKARVLLLAEERAEGADRRCLPDRDDIRPRRHHLADERVTEIDDALQQPPFLAFDDPFLLGALDVRLGDLVGFLGRFIRRRRRPLLALRGGHRAGHPAGRSVRTPSRPARTRAAGARAQRSGLRTTIAIGSSSSQTITKAATAEHDQRERVRAVDADRPGQKRGGGGGHQTEQKANRHEQQQRIVQIDAERAGPIASLGDQTQREPHQGAERRLDRPEVHGRAGEEKNGERNHAAARSIRPSRQAALPAQAVRSTRRMRPSSRS